MNTQDFICACLRCYKGECEYMDKLQRAFDVGLTEEDVRASIAIAGEYIYNNPGRPLQICNDLITRLYDKIKNDAQELYPQYAEEIADKFEYFVDGYASTLTFGGVQVDNWDQLCKQIYVWINSGATANEQ